MEIGLIGVDGTGKTSIASALAMLDPRVVVVYMGYKQFRTWPMKMYEQGRLGWPMGRFASHYEWFRRRMDGRRLARHGHIVVYDRHPAEHCDPEGRRLGDRVGNLLNRMYDSELDLSFYLTGDPEAIFARKREYSPEKLGQMDRTLRLVLAKKHIAFQELDVTSHPLASVIATVVAGINRKCAELGISAVEPRIGQRLARIESSTASAERPSSEKPVHSATPLEIAALGDPAPVPGAVQVPDLSGLTGNESNVAPPTAA